MPDIPHLGGRRVPFSVEWLLLFGGPYAQGGWLFLGIALIFAWFFFTPKAGFGVIIAVIVIGVFVAISGWMIVRDFRIGWRALQVFQRGRIADGTVKLIEPQDSYAGDRQLLQVTVDFTADDGRVYTTSGQTLMLRCHPSQATRVARGGRSDEPAEPDTLPFPGLPARGGEAVCYDPRMPEQAVVLSILPGNIGIDQFGHLYGVTAGEALRSTLTMLIAIVVHVGIAYYRFSQGGF
jgi:hypothetical protein